MTSTTKDLFAFAVIYLWIGFVCAISFMEAWLKFRAPGVNLSIGLGIGRLVFSALNKVEWVFAIALVSTLLCSKGSVSAPFNLFLLLAVILLVMQTFLLLPYLDARAQLHMDGKSVPASNAHLYYVAFEVTKTISLFIYSIKF
ncbi:hypothetical protein CNR22_15970 [Sphingobacteriaceae bacterium]|nr:hypothetical protein CNR22_15970 [Sphingobacteriaceae bacterium]